MKILARSVARLKLLSAEAFSRYSSIFMKENASYGIFVLVIMLFIFTQFFKVPSSLLILRR